ncbi:MAG: acetolactate synthase 3 large subunit [Candidatus Pacebacteria bacterium]|nr:acetolactate synthase 3 large subunit [Candidatus Paceibacterota bacterium]
MTSAPSTTAKNRVQAKNPESESRTMTGAEMVLTALKDHGVEVIFGYPGGAVLPIYDALFKQNSIRHILVRHEQAAVHAAEGYARSTGKIGCVLVTSGPGATNAVTGLVDALMDSIPLICVSGQVPTHLIGNDAFQEADTTGITRPATKHNYLVKNVDRLSEVLHQAITIATTGRPGPVLIDLPKDVQFASGIYTPPQQTPPPNYHPQTEPDPMLIDRALDMLSRAKRPVIYGGGGLINSGPEASKLLAEFVSLTGFPCTLTLMGLGALPQNDPHFIGMLGMHGLYEANLAMHGSDLILSLGARFDDRVTGNVKLFAPTAQKIHVDIDPSSINKNIHVNLAVVGDCTLTLRALIKGWKARKLAADKMAIAAWWQQIEEWRGRKCLNYIGSKEVIKPQYALERLEALTAKKDRYITTEVGQHQMWAAQYLHFNQPHRWMTSGGLGTMGYGLPAAMGVQIAHPDALVIDVAGEASILMNIQEMSTLAQYRLPVKVFILNNQWMGMVRQWQELLHGSRYSESYSEALPDFVKLADAFGATGLRVSDPAKLDETIMRMMEIEGAVIVDVMVDPKENCFPMIPSGAAHNQMLLGAADVANPATTAAGRVLV